MTKRTAACVLTVLLLSVSGAWARDFYWENPRQLVSTDSRFPVSAAGKGAAVVVWQEIQYADAGSGSIWLSARVFDGTKWLDRGRFAGPIPFAGDVPSISSVAMDSSNRIFVAAVTGINTVSVFESDDYGVSFGETNLNGAASQVLAPSIFVRSDGGYFLFATKGGEDNFTLVYSTSDNGRVWSPFMPFAPAAGMKRAFLPAHATVSGEDLIVFQAFHESAETSRSSYQLYSAVSSNGGKTWSAPAIITGFVEPGASADTAQGKFENYHNQRAALQTSGNSVSLVWERARTSSEKYAIYYCELDRQGRFSASPERISSGDGYCFGPDFIFFEGTPAVVWFDNRSGVNRVYLARKEGFLWTEADLSRSSRDAVFGRIIDAGGDLEVYWQQAVTAKSYRVFALSPDRSVNNPTVTGVNFASGAKGRGDLVRATVRLPADSSGIAGYSWSWLVGAKPDVPTVIQHLPEETRISVEATSDGTWFLGVRAADYAGNWSAPSYLEYTRDTVPPNPPVIADAGEDGDGALPSNTFSLSWSRPEGDDVAGYSWRFDYLAPLDYLAVLKGLAGGSAAALSSVEAERLPVSAPVSSILTTGNSVSFTNRDNGIYALSVAAIDSVGNVGKPAVRYYVLRNYIPYTYIAYADSKTDETGTINLSIVGRGFTEGGRISTVYFDRDGKPPYDMTLASGSGRFRVSGDRLISGITLSDMEEGTYRIGLVHPARGLYFTKPVLAVSASGTVKFGDYRHEFAPPWKETVPENRIAVRPGTILLYALFAFALVVLAFSVFGIAGTARDSLAVRQEVRALITGDIMPSERKKRSVALRKKGVGLRFKLTFFTTTLVISVVLLVSIPLGIQFSDNQERTLAQGLESRVHVLLESLASGAKAYLPSQNILELGFLPSQMSALDEARSATITGNSAGGAATGTDFVWATNDPAIKEKIDTTDLQYGRSRLEAPENEILRTRIAALDSEAALAVGELSDGITSLTQEGIKLALATDAASIARRDEIQTITRQLDEKLNASLTKLSVSGIGSYPVYNANELSRSVTKYVFYKPILYRQGSDTRYVHGTVRVEISTESLLATVARDRANLVRTTVYIALFAVLIGMIGSLVLASIIISPVRKLASHVAMIRDTEDKEELEGKDIKLRSRDEIGLLGETINDMTHGLVKAAAASKDLTVGKEVQKMFIPLETDSAGRKLTCGSKSGKHADFFGYYEGAKGVSGDYFDYLELDDRHYAIIKCDVSGKGVPAALIMVEVATLFLNYFRDWKYEKNGYKFGYIVSRINDLIESLGLKGRFAAFTLCLFDSLTGDAYFCNAGDNLVHIYDVAERKMKTLTFPETPASGVFPSFMVDLKGGFPVVKHHLNPGDILFLYTDGIEEAKRMFRTSDLVVHACAEPGLAPESPHGSHSVGQDNEEMGPERVNAIIEAVLARKTYSLFKWHNPEADAQYDFDFTTCEGTIEEAILALVSVEKVFRMYRDPKAGDFDRVQVDRKVDLFLNRHFRQYGLYCGNRRDHPDYPEYLYYTGVREDAQYDDLTILGIRKK